MENFVIFVTLCAIWKISISALGRPALVEMSNGTKILKIPSANFPDAFLILHSQDNGMRFDEN